MKVLVTGGAGYLGSVLCRRLLEEKHEVVCLDNLTFGKEPIHKLLGEKNFRLVHGDIKDMSVLSKTLSPGIDVVIHLASIVGKPAAEVNLHLTTQINFLATRNLAEFSRLFEVEKFIFASTCSVYGDQPEQVITEASPAKPIEIYADYKLKSEAEILKTLPNATIMRMGTLFGLSPRMRYDLVINRFIAQSIQDRKITVFGGNQFRPFMHVSDAAESYVLAIKKNLEGIYNVSWKNLKLNDVGKYISDKMKSELVVSQDIVDFRNYKVDSSKINKEGFKPLNDIDIAVNEISEVFAKEHINYNAARFNNQGTLLEQEEIRKKVYTQGPLWS